MIIFFLLYIFVLFLSGVFSLLPVANLASIPIIGIPLRSALVQMVAIWNSAMDTFPYAEIVWNIFLYVIVPFELFMLILKFFLGGRLPSNNIN